MKDFKQFLMRGNVVDLAVGVVIGLAFGAVVTNFVAAFITPLIALVVGRNGLAALTFTVSGSTFPYGVFLNALLSFLIIAAVVFFLVVKPINILMSRARHEHADPTTRNCPECLSEIPIEARRCAFCTSEVASV